MEHRAQLQQLASTLASEIKKTFEAQDPHKRSFIDLMESRKIRDTVLKMMKGQFDKLTTQFEGVTDQDKSFFFDRVNRGIGYPFEIPGGEVDGQKRNILNAQLHETVEWIARDIFQKHESEMGRIAQLPSGKIAEKNKVNSLLLRKLIDWYKIVSLFNRNISDLTLEEFSRELREAFLTQLIEQNSELLENPEGLDPKELRRRLRVTIETDLAEFDTLIQNMVTKLGEKEHAFELKPFDIVDEIKKRYPEFSLESGLREEALEEIEVLDEEPPEELEEIEVVEEEPIEEVTEDMLDHEQEPQELTPDMVEEERPSAEIRSTLERLKGFKFYSILNGETLDKLQRGLDGLLKTVKKEQGEKVMMQVAQEIVDIALDQLARIPSLEEQKEYLRTLGGLINNLSNLSSEQQQELKVRLADKELALEREREMRNGK